MTGEGFAPADYFEPRVRMGVFLEEIVATLESERCSLPGCLSTATFRAAVDVLRDYIKAWPVDCDCYDG